MSEPNRALATKSALADKSAGYITFALAFDNYPTAAQEAYMLGDDSKWEQARREGQRLVGKEPVELVLYKGRYEHGLSGEERELLLAGELPEKRKEK